MITISHLFEDFQVPHERKTTDAKYFKYYFSKTKPSVKRYKKLNSHPEVDIGADKN